MKSVTRFLSYLQYLVNKINKFSSSNNKTKSKKLNLQEFVDKGYLQEVNRQFFHPLGLALEVNINKGKAISLGNICDHRDDPERTIFENLSNKISKDKAFNIEEQKQKLSETRLKLLGYSIQPIG